MTTILGYNPRFEPRIADAIPLDLVQQIWDEGLRVRWEKAQRCACNLKVTNAGDATYGFLSKEGDIQCPDCKGTGYLYYGAQEIRALVSATSDNPKWLELYGELADGSVQVTLLPEHVPSKRDRFTVLDQIRRYDEQLVHKTNPEALTYPIIVTPTTTGTSEADPYTPTTENLGILNARRADSNGLIVATPMVVGTDVDVTAAGLVEYLNAGTYASGLAFLGFAGNTAGVEIPAGSTFTITSTGLSYSTTATGWTAVFSGGLYGVVLPIIAAAAGAAYNLAIGEYDFTSSTLPSGFLSTIGISNGTDPGEGGNIPAVGDVVSFDYYCRPSYIVRVLPHYAREAYVASPPYVNTSTGDQGYWDASTGVFPTGTIARGDYYEVSVEGAVDGVDFIEGQFLVALIASPSSTAYAGQWQRLTPGVVEAQLVKLPTMVLCWLEDLGDPQTTQPQVP